MNPILPLLAALLMSPVVQDDRKPVPEEKTQKEFDSIIREVFKEDFAKTAPADRKLLVGKLLKQAAETRNDPPAVYALLVHARTIAAQIGEIKGGTQAVDELVKQYAVDSIALRKSFLAEASKAAKTTEEFSALTEGYLAMADEAVAANSLAEAQAAAVAAAALAKRAKSIPLINRAEARVRELGEQKAMGDLLQKAREALAKAPEDALANYLVGKQECLSGNWEKGLLHLLKGSDAVWKEAAGRDSADPGAAAQQVAAGDGWWDLADKEKGSARTALQRRAVLWYGRAEGQVAGLTLVKVRKRLAEAAGAGVAAEGPSSLLAYWPFNEAAGTEAADVRGGPPAVAARGVTFIPGRSGNAVKLDGASGHLSAVDSDRFNFGKSGFTVACWINVSGTGHYRILNKWDNSVNRGWLLDLHGGQPKPDGTIQNEAGHLRARLSDGKVNLNYSANGNIGPGAWKHVAMSVDYSSREMKLFVDGAQIGTGLALKDLTDLDSSTPLGIGTIPKLPGSFFNGAIDEVKIFRETLSAAAIKALAVKP